MGNPKIMMNGMILSMLLLFFMSMTRCTKEDPEMTLSEMSMNFTPSGGEKTVILFSNIKSWTFSSDAPDWLSFTPATGANNSLVTVTASANTGTTARTATITIDGSKVKSETIRVTQATTPILDVSPKQMNFIASGGERTISVSSNAAWGSTTTFINSTSWFTASPGNGDGNNNTITIKCSQNTSGRTREASIRISITGLSQYISVSQAP